MDKGGIDVRTTVEQTHLTPEEMGDIIRSFGYTSAIVTLRADTTAEMLVDTMVGTLVYSKSVIAVNKIDIASEAEISSAEKHYRKTGQSCVFPHSREQV